MVIKMRISRILAISLFAICIAVVSWGVFRAMPPQEIFEQSDKIAHLLAFAGLAFSGRMAMPKLNGHIYWPLITTVAMAMEYTQGLVQASRLSSVEDAIANVMGVAIAMLVWVGVQKFRRARLVLKGSIE